jgi:hypothetical protein
MAGPQCRTRYSVKGVIPGTLLPYADAVGMADAIVHPPSIELKELSPQRVAAPPAIKQSSDDMHSRAGFAPPQPVTPDALLSATRRSAVPSVISTENLTSSAPTCST